LRALKHIRHVVRVGPNAASPLMDDFPDEVMSHLQTLPDAEVNLPPEIHVQATQEIEDSTARIVLENSSSLKVESCSIH
jgi:hypothetical protein